MIFVANTLLSRWCAASWLPILLILSLYTTSVQCVPTATTAAPAPTATSPTDPGDDTVLESKLDKYSLPYGVLGAIDHIATFYAIGCHFYERRPLAPHKLIKHKLLNLLNILLASVVTVTIAFVTLSKVKEDKPLLIFAALHVVLDVIKGIVNIHKYLNEEKGLVRMTVVWGIILYAVSYIALYALSQMMGKRERLQGRFDGVSIPILVVILVSALIAFVSFIVWVKGSCRKEAGSLHVVVVSGLICSCGYFLAGDWGVAVMTGNTIGSPDNSSVASLFWTYWIFGRFALLTW
ncbi:hypothetical protein MKZ38_004485 [Zalerion maritima]|uniref:Uncharacterized protein n=1 Tax=Zalerion maritima TaxID=339359 RepID=A0AAD5RLA0_9PEZI|nr:hypothetical protein MKZ38_004485 [Zalerion maritima]